MDRFPSVRGSIASFHIHDNDSKFGPAMATELGMARVAGTRVTSVAANGPAAAAGVRPGDVILKLDETTIDDDAHLVNLVGMIEAD